MSPAEISAWISLALVVVGIASKFYLVLRATKSWGQALQTAAEMAAVNLTAQGLPDQANQIGKTIGTVMEASSPLIQKINAKAFTKTKANMAKDGIDLRALISDATRRQAGGSNG